MRRRNFIIFTIFLPFYLYAQNYTIAFVQDTMANDFRKAQVYQVKKELQKYKNINFVFSDALGQTALLIFQLDKFIDKKVDVIILGTNDGNAVVPSLIKAQRAKIPVIILGRGVDTDKYTTFINSDNVKIGQMAGDFISRKLGGKGTIVLFEGIKTTDIAVDRTKGFEDVVSHRKGIKIIKVTGNYLRRDAIIATEKLIAKGIKFDAIFSESDSMLSGARLAMIKHGIDPKNIISIGCGYINEAKVAIEDGLQTGSIKSPHAGQEAAKIAMDIINKKNVKKHILMPITLITKDNVDSIKPIF
ncbi:MAG: substrate-binding domain-containing protein [Sulfurospirillaceae bacterium]|nr:substrate-binding domain-containing protein [Sulfurospirillaceae bacterium]